MHNFLNYLVALNQKAKKNFTRYHSESNYHQELIHLTRCYEDLDIIKSAVKPFKFPKWFKMGKSSISYLIQNVKGIHRSVHDNNIHKIYLLFDSIDTNLEIMQDGVDLLDFDEIHYSKARN